MKLYNPYLTAFEQANNDSRHRYDHRIALVKQYAWAVPNDDAINTLTALSPLIEVGAGSGYWASLIRQAQGTIHAFDTPVGASAYSFDAKHAPISVGGAGITAHYPKHTLFICWPPYDNSFAYDALMAHRRAGGTKLVYVGEGSYGCTGDSHFHNLLMHAYNLTDTVHIPQWYGMHDALYVYTRK